MPATAALALAGLLAQAQPSPPAVRIASPTAADVLVGRVELVVHAAAPPDASLLKVELYVDDRLVATLLDPPFRFVWDAGDALRARSLRAKAYASNGTTAVDRVTTRAAAGVQRASVTLVEVYCTVRDRQGGYVDGLKKGDFTVLEAGVPQEIAVFSDERRPAHLVLLLDTSASMERDDRLRVAQEAAAGFVRAMEPTDTSSLVAFSDQPRLMQEPTSDRVALERAVASVEARGGTALYDALVAAVGLLKGIEGRKAIVLLSDGRDESSDGLGPGSVATFEQALEAVLRSEIAVYVVGTGEALEREMDYDRRRSLKEILEQLSGRTGGRAYFVKKASRLKDAYRRIEDELRHQYLLAYYPPGEPPRGKTSKDGWRPIEVTVSRPAARITHRDGYYARD